MTQASFSTSGSTQNIWSAIGATGTTIPSPVLSTQPNIKVVWTSHVFNANPSDSGCNYLIPTDSAASTINLGVPATTPAGTKWKFTFSATALHAVTFASQTASVIYGCISSPLVTAAATAKAFTGNSNAISPATPFALFGDTLDVWTDQTNWYISGLSQSTVAWTSS